MQIHVYIYIYILYELFSPVLGKLHRELLAAGDAQALHLIVIN